MIVNRIISTITLGIGLLSGSFNMAMPDKNINGNIFLVNNSNMISKEYQPYTIAAKVFGNANRLSPEAAEAAEIMFKDAKREKIKLFMNSAYRQYSNQVSIFNRKLDRNNGKKEKANEYVALPGASEHQLGLAADVVSESYFKLHPDFGKTKEGIWLAENAYKYGFIVRYQKDFEDITGIKAEPWHLRYVGKDAALAIHMLDNIPLEKYISLVKLNIYWELLQVGN